MSSHSTFSPDIAGISKEKTYYALTMFPYPSGSGLHCGHASVFTINDVVARYKRMQGYTVLNPFGFDAFGLPTENYAIQQGKPAREVTDINKQHFLDQVNVLNMSFDMSRIIDTSEPEYYKRTQWIFSKLYEAGLVYKDTLWVNRCPSCMTVLANDQVVDGKCERCKSEITQKKHPQWFIKITDYADRLLADLETVDRPEETKIAQRNRIGKSVGAEIDFMVVQGEKKEMVTCFTTRPDTIYGVTALVLAPESTLLDDLLDDDRRAEVETYRQKTLAKTSVQRQQDLKEKTGVNSGLFALHPLTNEKIPVWYADYVLAGYGSGAVMSVPAHDQRDLEFARKFGLEIVQVIKPTLVEGDFDTIERERVGGYGLIQRSSDNAYLVIESKGQLQLPGGGANPGEEILDTVHREVQEETGFTDLQVDKELLRIDARYYSGKTQCGVYTDAYIYKVQITSDNNVGISLDEYEKNCGMKPVWMTEDEILSASKTEIWEHIFAILFGKETVRDGTLINSGEFDGLSHTQAQENIIAHLESTGVGRKKTTYKLRDRSVSRQRYWGSPIPVWYDEEGNDHLVQESELPVVLPLDLENYKPDGKSPLEDHPTFPRYKKMKKKIMIAMTGYIGSGKSQVARYISEKTGGVIFISDKYRKEIIKERGVTQQEANTSTEIKLEIERRRREDINKVDNDIIIFDACFTSQRQRELIKELAHTKGYEYVFVQVVADEDNIKERISERQADGVIQFSGGIFEDYVEHKKIYEDFGDEHVIEIDNNGSVKELYVQLNSFIVSLGEEGRVDLGTRECDTLDTFMCSSFYFLRFPDAHNPDELIRKELAESLLPVDFYTGGKEHTVGHLLYSRFIHKFLFDQGYVDSPEPFKKLVHQGMVLGADGRKMGKRYGNGIDPIDVVNQYSADAVRTYLMFMGPVEADKPWSDTSLNGVAKFLKRVETLLTSDRRGTMDADVESLTHETISGITHDIENLKLNTCISKLMILVNLMYEKKAVTDEQLTILGQLLAPFATEMAQKIRGEVGGAGDVHYSTWPVADESKIVASAITLPIQVNGKVRAKIEIAPGLTEDEVMVLATAHENIAKWIEGKDIRKIIWVQDKILNVIV